MTFELTPAHRAIVDAVERGDRNLIIEAVAGAGKTSTLMMLLDHVNPQSNVLFLVFAKRNASDIEQRAPEWVQVRTMNALGHRALSSMFPRLRLDKDKTRKIAGDVCANPRLKAPACKLVSLAKSAGILPARMFDVPGLVPDVYEEWLALLNRHDIELPEKIGAPDVITAAREILRRSCADTASIDYDDQLLLTYALGAPVPQFDWVFTDESQDLSPLQHALVARTMRPDSRLVAVGDSRQAIFAFRGADADSMATMARTFNCLPLPLHVSYRCPQAVVAEAQKYVQHIQAHPSAPVGTVDRQVRLFDDVAMQPGDMVVCRFSAPTVKCAFSLLRRGIPAVVMGRDIGKGLKALVKQIEAVDLPDLLALLGQWEDKQRAAAGDDENKQQAIEDKAETLRVFAEMSDDLPALDARIESMFSDASPDGVVTCCTIHKSKGLEAERVFVIDDERPSRAKQAWQIQQEHNLKYVAYTRAKSHLQFVSSGKGLGKRAAQGATLAAVPVAWVALRGDTFNVKEELKALGARWNTTEHPGCWSIHPSKLEEAQKMIGVTVLRSPAQVAAGRAWFARSRRNR